jgi:hypothetical protein
MTTVTPDRPVSIVDLRHMTAGRFGDLVKAVIDLARETMLLGAELHAGEEAELLATGSR